MIPLAAPQIPDEGVERVEALLREGTLSTGDVVAEFEGSMAPFCDREHAVAVASGSVALELALKAVFEAGDRIALCPYNCGAVLYSVLRTDLEPVFVDADEATGALSPEALREKRVDGVLLSHLFGHPALTGEICEVAEEIGATVVEDFAQAPGATYDGRPTGSFGRVSVGSFGATKNLTSAEGGMVLTDDDSLGTFVRGQRSNTADRTPPPRSVRMNDLEAAVGLSQLDQYETVVERKRTIAETYRTALGSMEFPALDPAADHVYHAFPVLTEAADALADHLRDNGVETGRLYDRPLHRYETAPTTPAEFPGVERFSERLVLLPIHAALDEGAVETVVDTLAAFSGGPNQ